MMDTKVSRENIRKIIDGFNEFYTHVTETMCFSPLEMLNFMEPRFSAAGYRQISNTVSYNKGRTHILIICDSPAIGDFVVASALIREIRRVYEKSYITMVVYKNIFPLAEFCPYVDEVITYEKYFSTEDFPQIFSSTLNFAKNFLPNPFDLAFALSYGSSHNSILLSYMAGAKERISSPTGFNAIFADLLTQNVPLILHGTHATDTSLGYLDYYLHAPVANRKTEVWYSPADLNYVRQFIEPDEQVIALCVGGSTKFKHYPPQMYAKFLNLLSQKENNRQTIVIIGADADKADGEIIFSLARESNIVNLAGELTLRQSAAALSLCNFCIGNDTSTNHMAAACGVPTLCVSAFAADITLPFVSVCQRWYPYAVPSVVLQPKTALGDCRTATNFFGCVADEPHCITQIAPEILLQAFSILRERASQNICEPIFVCAN